MATPTQFDKRLIALYAIDAINNSGITNGTIAGWTTTAQFVTGIGAQAFKTFSEKLDYQAYVRNAQIAVDAGIYTNANISSAGTRAGLVAVAQAFIPGTPNNQQGGSHWWS